jgi:hypothetical protein
VFRDRSPADRVSELEGPGAIAPAASGALPAGNGFDGSASGNAPLRASADPVTPTPTISSSASSRGRAAGLRSPLSRGVKLAGHRLQGRDDLRVELGSGAGSNLVQGFGRSSPAPVGAVGADRVEGVGARDDPTCKRRLLPASLSGYPVPSQRSCE